MATSTLTVRPVAGALGADVFGIDLRDLPGNDALVAEVRALWLEHQVLSFRDQTLDGGEFEAFARCIGELDRYPMVPSIDGHDHIIEVRKEAHERVNFGGIWHSDTTYLEQPPMATMLLAREIPPAGGDTLYADQYAAFEALSPAMQELLTPLRGVSSSALADVSKTREDRIRDANEVVRDYEAVHPVVRTHPETGRKALFVNVAHTARFEGMTDDESRGLLQYLFHHQVRPEFTCRVRWEVGTLTLWDNRCVQHNPVNDYHGHRRVMHRITLKGDRPS